MPDLDAIFDRDRDVVSHRRVVGEPVEVDDVTIVPVSLVVGGRGGGGDERGNGGGGFGVVARPLGAFVIRDGDVRWKPVVTPTQVLLGALALLLLARRR